MADEGDGLSGDSLGGVYVEIGTDQSKLEADFRRAQENTIKFAQSASDAAKVKIQTTIEPPKPAAASSFNTEQQLRAEMARTRLAQKAEVGGGYELEGQADKYKTRMAELRGELDKVRDAHQSVSFMARAAADQESQYVNVTARSSTAMRDAQASSRNLGMGILFVSQAIEDAQYGFRSVLNNIPGIVMAMGGGPGLAGVISVLGVGINVLTQNWDNMKASFSDDSWAKKAMQGIEDVYGTLTDESTKQAKRQAEAQSKERAKATAGVLAEGSNESDRKGAAITSALKDYGTGKQIVSELLRKAMPAIDEEAQKRAEAARDKVTYYGASGSFVREVELDNAKKAAKREEERRNMVGDMVAKAKGGDQAAIDQLLQATKGTKLGQSLRMSLQSSQEEIAAQSPESQRIKKQLELEAIGAEKAREDADAAAKAEERAAAKQAEDRQAQFRRTADDAASALMGSMGLDLMLGKDRDYAKDAKDALVKSGRTQEQADELAEAVVDTLKSKVTDRIQKRSLSDRVDFTEAAGLEAKDLARKDQDDKRRQLKEESTSRKMEFVGIDEMVKRIQSANVGEKTEDIPKKTLDEIKGLRSDIKKSGATPRPAKFGR